jgi:hypothetical protein
LLLIAISNPSYYYYFDNLLPIWIVIDLVKLEVGRD